MIEGGGERPPERHEVAQLHRGELAPDTLGLKLAEAKQLLAGVQEVIVAEQVSSCLATRVACPHCGRPRRHKDARTITLRTLFGSPRLPSPRWHHCPCRPQQRKTFSPLAEILPERITPELLYLEPKFAGLISYGLRTDDQRPRPEDGSRRGDRAGAAEMVSLARQCVLCPPGDR